jgi:putative heme transporter
LLRPNTRLTLGACDERVEADQSPITCRRTPRPALRGLLALLVVGVVVYVAVLLVGGFSDGAAALGSAQLAWLVAAVGVEAGAYLLLGTQLRRLVGADAHLSRGRSLRLTMILCGFGCVTPASPAEGMVITGTELRRRGLSTRRVAVTLGLAEFLSALAIAGLAALNVLVAAARSDLPAGEAGPLIAAALMLLVAVGAVEYFARRPQTAERMAVILGALCFWRPRVPVEMRRAAGAAWHTEASAVAGSTGNRVVLLALAAGAWLADVVCCYLALASLGVVLPFEVVLLAYTVGVLATLVPFLPAGVGLVETAMPLVLHSYGAPLGAAIAAVLVYRCVSTLLPAAVGLGCIPGLGRRRRPPLASKAGPVLASTAAA